MSIEKALSHDEFEQHLQEQLQFMRASCESFDQGHESEAKRLALTIRVLFHDTRQSHSLLGQLGLKERRFFDSATPEIPGNLLAYNGLVVMMPGRYLALLDEVPSMPMVPFEEWWTASVIADDEKRWSRKDLVLISANKDGGGHVDPTLDETFSQLKKTG